MTFLLKPHTHSFRKHCSGCLRVPRRPVILRLALFIFHFVSMVARAPPKSSRSLFSGDGASAFGAASVGTCECVPEAASFILAPSPPAPLLLERLSRLERSIQTEVCSLGRPASLFRADEGDAHHDREIGTATAGELEHPPSPYFISDYGGDNSGSLCKATCRCSTTNTMTWRRAESSQPLPKSKPQPWASPQRPPLDSCPQRRTSPNR